MNLSKWLMYVIAIFSFHLGIAISFPEADYSDKLVVLANGFTKHVFFERPLLIHKGPDKVYLLNGSLLF